MGTSYRLSFKKDESEYLICANFTGLSIMKSVFVIIHYPCSVTNALMMKFVLFEKKVSQLIMAGFKT